MSGWLFWYLVRGVFSASPTSLVIRNSLPIQGLILQWGCKTKNLSSFVGFISGVFWAVCCCRSRGGNSILLGSSRLDYQSLITEFFPCCKWIKMWECLELCLCFLGRWINSCVWLLALDAARTLSAMSLLLVFWVRPSLVDSLASGQASLWWNLLSSFTEWGCSLPLIVDALVGGQ